MKRRSKAGAPIKGRRRKPPKPERRNPPKTGPRSKSSQVVARLTHELREITEQHTATSEILRVISSSPSDLQPVFQAMLKNAVRLCDAKFGNIYRWDGASLHLVATQNVPASFVQARGRSPLRPSLQTPTGRMIATKTVVHVADMRAEKAYAHRDPYIVAGVELGGVRSALVVPMLKDDELIGSFSVYRQEVRAFTDKQIALVQNFATQAVIAIENARLLSELREMLQQKTATADVLKIISRSTFDLPKVLNTLLEWAARLCEADKGVILRPSGDESYYAAAIYRHTPKFIESQMGIVFTPGRSGVVGRVLLEGKSVQIPDVLSDPEYAFGEFARLGDFRTILGVPLVREGVPIGLFVLHRAAVRPFTEKQIKLVETFADQAVIAIENNRLLNELRQRTNDLTDRTADLTEALEQQTATSEVLGIISNSPGELRAVFDAMLANATRLCGASYGTMWLHENEGQMRMAARHGPLPEAFSEKWRVGTLFIPSSSVPTARVFDTRQPVQVRDLKGDRSYLDGDPLAVASVNVAGIRSLIAVPMQKENTIVGAMTIYRQEVRPFTDKQIELVTNFAAQAVIAIENARLLNELRGALERQTATSEVLQVISGSPGDLEPVFAAMLESAVRTCGAKFGNIYRVEGDGLCNVATHNTPTAFAEALRGSPYFSPGPNNPVRRMMQTKTIVHVLDVAASEAYTEREPITVASVELGQTRTLMIVPMLKDNELVGAFTLARQEVRSFTDKQIELVKNFAAQAIIAIENARLLNELRQRTSDLTERSADLTEALEQQTATSEVLQVISGSAGDVEPAFATMLEKAVRICDATFGNIYRWDGEALHLVATRNTPPAFAEARSRLTLRPGSTSLIGRMLATKAVVHIADVAATQAYEQRVPETVAAVEVGGVRTILGVPMLNEGELIGSFTLYRQEVRPFTDKQIALVTNFAAQAVIAIKNARLLNELRQRTDDLSETLEQQTASAKVLEVISRSAFDLHAVFETVAESSVRLCEADRAFIFQYDSELLRVKAFYNASPELADWVRKHPVRPGSHLASARAALHRQTIHIPDVQVDPDYLHGGKLVDAFRTVLAVPVLKSDDLLGIILIYRLDVQPFTAKQIALVETFADQAAIAIENARLLQELRERTDEVVELNQQLELRVSDQVGEIERMGRLRRFLPPQVADLIVASGSEKQLESHRREITALFCDLRGFTGFTESADAEDVMALLRDYHAAIGEIIIKYNGTLERYAGDGVMVVFNDPVPVENPALQAVLMALEVREAIGALTETWRRLGHDIGFGIGIAHGFATLGTIGFEGRFDYAAIGTVSNVASRLCDEAKPGQILISPRVLMKVEDAVKVEPVGEFELKGIRRPLAAYNVVGGAS